MAGTASKRNGGMPVLPRASTVRRREMRAKTNTRHLRISAPGCSPKRIVFLRESRSCHRSRAACFPPPLQGFSIEGFRTQGSASLHPWATILRRFAAQKALSDVYWG